MIYVVYILVCLHGKLIGFIGSIIYGICIWLCLPHKVLGVAKAIQRTEQHLILQYSATKNTLAEDTSIFWD